MPVQTRSTDEGFAYRDLNKNGRLDPYEDPRLPIEERVEDLLVSAAGRAVLVFLIGKLDPAPLPAAVARRAWGGRRRGFCTRD
jgi:hypothetical protein